MKAFFDTSVLVPVFLPDHVHHTASLARLQQVDRKSGGCAAHSLAEVYSTLTRLPGKIRVTGEQAMLFVADLRQKLSVTALDADEYYEALGAAATRGISGGTVYDALLAACAVKAGAKFIYTWNVRHYAQFGPDIASRIQMP